MKADGWWVVGAALAVFLTVLGVLVDRYLCAVYWWPLVGTEWRAERASTDSPLRGDDQGWESSADRGHSALAGGRSPESGSLSPRLTGRTLVSVTADQASDDDWADQLHVINLATRVHPLLERSKTRAMGDLLHDEVEAVIRDLGVPEWVPQRYRTAA